MQAAAKSGVNRRPATVQALQASALLRRVRPGGEHIPETRADALLDPRNTCRWAPRSGSDPERWVAQRRLKATPCAGLDRDAPRCLRRGLPTASKRVLP